MERERQDSPVQLLLDLPEPHRCVVSVLGVQGGPGWASHLNALHFLLRPQQLILQVFLFLLDVLLLYIRVMVATAVGRSLCSRPATAAVAGGGPEAK